jgi:glutathione S-transferase
MALKVLWGSGSGPSWRVLLALTIKRIPFKSQLVSFANREHKSPEALAINPRGKVPMLCDGDYTLYESLAILTYLDRKQPEPPLFGRTAEEAGTIMRVVMEHECYGGPAVSSFTRPILNGKLAEKKDDVLGAVAPLKEELARLETQLGARSWLVGEAISAADVFVFPAIKTLERALSKPGVDAIGHGLPALEQGLPALAAWRKRIEALPFYDATYPPHWREG